MSVYDSQYRLVITELLSTLKPGDAFDLCGAATKNRIAPEDEKEAIKAILLHTPTLERLFSYRRLTSQVLHNYLFQKNVSFDGHVGKIQLISSLLKYWDQRLSKSREISDISKKENNQIATTILPSIQPYETKDTPELNVHINVQTIITNLTTVTKSDIFATEFCEWYYTMINRLQSQCEQLPGDTLKETCFCTNASLDIYLITQQIKESWKANNNIETEALLRKCLQSLKFLHSPNLLSGVQAHRSNHGLIKVLCSGTIHVDDSLVGIYEQEFGLAQNPVDHLWKIYYSKVNYKQGVTSLPALPPCEVFDIV